VDAGLYTWMPAGICGWMPRPFQSRHLPSDARPFWIGRPARSGPRGRALGAII